MKMARIVRGVALVGTSVAVLAACVVPADPEHVAYYALTNECDDPIWAAASKRLDGFPTDGAPSSLMLVEPHTRLDKSNPLYLPVEEKLYLWVVAPDAESIGNPQEVKLAELERETDLDGGIVFHITVSGAMCPT